MQDSSQIITTNKPTSSFFTGQMPFLSPNQQCQSTEGNITFHGLAYPKLTWGSSNRNYQWYILTKCGLKSLPLVMEWGLEEFLAGMVGMMMIPQPGWVETDRCNFCPHIVYKLSNLVTSTVYVNKSAEHITKVNKQIQNTTSMTTKLLWKWNEMKLYCFWHKWSIILQITQHYAWNSLVVSWSLLGYWHQWADERHGNPPQGNQELLVVRDKVGRPPGELG